MREAIATGKKLEEIREQWAAEWSCSPEELIIEVLEKPSLLRRNWKVKVALPEPQQTEAEEKTVIAWDGHKYIIKPGKKVETVIPYEPAGKLFSGDEEVVTELTVNKGVSLEFYPVKRKGGLTWNIEADPEGHKAVAKVRHGHAGCYKIVEDIPDTTRLYIEKITYWEPSSEPEEVLHEEDLKKDLADRGIVYGLKPNLWIDFLTVDGWADVVVAEYTPPLPTVQPQLLDYVGQPVSNNEHEDEEKELDFVDYFGSKLRICQKDEVLAEKIPGSEGKPGMDIYGNIIPVEKLVDFEFKLKKNVYLSEDGLQVKAACAGTPVRANKYTYLVENIYYLNKSVTLETGSIDFPGDVIISEDVTDGFYVYSGGKLVVKGAVSGATLKAETGLTVQKNILASKVIVGERHVFRFELVEGLRNLVEDLGVCIVQADQLRKASGNENVGQLLKILIERKFMKLPEKAEQLQKLLSFKDPEYVTKELELAVQTAQQFLVGLGPLKLKDLDLLKNILKVMEHFLTTKGEIVSSNVHCETTYVQNSEISCAGDFLCKKGMYNSSLKVEGDVTINGVFRGGTINCSGNIYIWELGGSSMSATVIKTLKDSKITIEYCHQNIMIYVGKELVRIDEPMQKVEIYRDKSMVQFEKLKWDGKI